MIHERHDGECEQAEFRLRLRAHTRAAHRRLESHPWMRDYAQGNLDADAYATVVGALLSFWQRVEPDPAVLPTRYGRFLAAYRAALRADGAIPPEGQPQPQAVNEIAFFYLLLGSSHGAHYMLQHQPCEPHPWRHLRLLATEGKALWSCFVREGLGSVSPAEEEQVMRSARRLFDDLCQNLDAWSGAS